MKNQKYRNKKNIVEDTSLNLEESEIVLFMTTTQIYNFVSSLNKEANIHLRYQGSIEIENRTSTETCTLYSYTDTDAQINYILMNIKNNNLDKILKSYDKLLIINGDFNRIRQTQTICSYSLPNTLEIKHLDFDEPANPKLKQAMDNLRKFFETPFPSKGLLTQIEQYLKNRPTTGNSMINFEQYGY